MTEDELRTAYAKLMKRPPGADRSGCPGVEALSALVERSGPETTRLATLDHVMSCPKCKAEFELLRSFAAVSSRRPSRVPHLALAASVLLLLGAGLVWRTRQVGVEPTRGATPAVVTLSPEGEVTSRVGLILVWRAVSAASTYRVEVLREGASVVWSTTTSDTTAAVADSAKLEPEVAYDWWVRAELEDGSEVASTLRRFRITRP